MAGIAHHAIQLRPRAQAYLAKHRAAGKTSRDAMRCLKRRLSDVIWRQLIPDFTTPPEAPLIG